MSVLAERPGAALVAAFVAGALAVAGFAPLALWPLPILSAACLFALWQSAATPRAALLAGLAFGAGLFGAGTSWIYVSLHEFGMMPAPLAALATFLFCAGLALFPAAAGWCYARLAPARGATTASLTFAALWMLAEWLREWFLTGFPWLALGYSQTDSPLAGFAPVFGVFGVSFVAALCAALLVFLFSGPARNRIAAALTIALVFGLGQLLRQIEWTSPQGAPLRVALLQGNIPQDLKFQAERYARTLATYRRLIDAAQAQLIVLPETAIPRFLDSVDPAYLEDIARIARERRADLIVGAPLRDAGGYFNSVVSLGVSPSQRYDKSHLVPLGEFVPPGFGWIVRILSIPLSDFSRGPDNPRPLALAGQRIAPDICYEDAFGEEIIRQLPQATLLVNVSNVAWFGDSLAPGQHLQISRMRSLETGRVMLRATNTGMTAAIDARGNVVAQLPRFSEGVLTADVQGRSGATPYVRFGNMPALALAAVFLLAAVVRARLPR